MARGSGKVFPRITVKYFLHVKDFQRVSLVHSRYRRESTPVADELKAAAREETGRRLIKHARYYSLFGPRGIFTGDSQILRWIFELPMPTGSTEIAVAKSAAERPHKRTVGTLLISLGACTGSTGRKFVVSRAEDAYNGERSAFNGGADRKITKFMGRLTD